MNPALSNCKKILRSRKGGVKRIIILTFSFILLLSSYAACEETIKMATTTSVYETGILDYILKPFEERNGVKVHIISVGTGKAIKLGENGDVDIILVHAREAEERFIKEGYGVNRRDCMYNDFIIVGPKNDPAEIAGLKSAKESLKKILDGACTFISRGDNSGTHKKEKYLWKQVEIEPAGQWYLESGQGMSPTLRIADEKNAYCLVDRATFLFHKERLRLVNLVEGDKDLLNPYGVIAVSPYKYPSIKYELAMKLIAWFTSPDCQKMIAEYKKNGEKLFYPNAALGYILQPQGQ